jgi:transposase-like protein
LMICHQYVIRTRRAQVCELLDALKAADAGDVVTHAVEAVFKALIDAEATARVGAEPHQRTPARVARRNGYRDRMLTTAAGDLELRIPKLRSGMVPCSKSRRGCLAPFARIGRTVQGGWGS